VAGRVGSSLVAALPGGPFDVVLADPPYRTPAEDVDAVLGALLPHVAPAAVVVVERDRRDTAPTWPQWLEAREPRRYGNTVLHRADRLV